MVKNKWATLAGPVRGSVETAMLAIQTCFAVRFSVPFHIFLS